MLHRLRLCLQARYGADRLASTTYLTAPDRSVRKCLRNVDSLMGHRWERRTGFLKNQMRTPSMRVPMLGCLPVRRGGRDGSFGDLLNYCMYPARQPTTTCVGLGPDGMSPRRPIPCTSPAVRGSKRQVVGMPRSYQPRVLAVGLDTNYDYHRALTSTPAAPGVTAT